MAITHRTFVLLTFPVCCASVALLITALATNVWIDAHAEVGGNVSPQHITYGLFNGRQVKWIALIQPRTYSIHLTCLSDEGVCAWSCLNSTEDRQAEVRQLYTTGHSSYLNDCSNSGRLQTANLAPGPSHHVKPREVFRSSARVDGGRSHEGYQKSFISLGLWASTITFVGLAILLAAVGAAFAVINTAGNPVEPMLGVFGLFVWNIGAVVSVTTALSLWGAQFAHTLTKNVALADTIVGNADSEGQATLGYSYWLMLAAGLLHLVNVGLLLYRRHLILTEPPAPTVRMDEDPDGAIFLY